MNFNKILKLIKLEKGIDFTKHFEDYPQDRNELIDQLIKSLEKLKIK